MTSIKKTLLSAIIALMTVCSLLFGITLINSSVTARADEELTAADFAVAIAVRVKDDEHPNGGIRFKVRVAKSKFETLMTDGVLNEGVQTGVLVTSNAIAKTLEGGLIKANAEEAGVYDLDTTDYWKAITENEVDYYESVVAIYNVPTDRSNVKLAVMPYVVNGETTVYRNEAGVASMADAVLADEENGADFADTYIHTYTITYYDIAGEAIDGGSEEKQYGDTIAEAKVAAPEVTGYTFDAWKNEAGTAAWTFGENGTKVTGDTKLYAKYTINTYGVTFNSNGGSEVASQTLDYNTTAAEPSEPTRAGYTFAGWQLGGEDYDFTTPVTDNITLDAVWTANTYYVTFKNGEETVGEPVAYTVETESITEPAVPTKEGYTGAWETYDLTTVGGITVNAVYTPIVYTATIDRVVGDDEEVKFTIENRATVLAGITLTADTDEWDYSWTEDLPEVLALNNTQVFTETRAKKTYTITWLDDDGETVLDTATLEYGETPVYDGTPEKAATAQYTYTFNGWSPEVSTVTGDATYTATYSSTVNKYTVTWKAKTEGGDILENLGSDEVEYGTVPVYNNGETPVYAETEDTLYTFKEWDTEIVAVTGDATYTAIFFAEAQADSDTLINFDNGADLRRLTSNATLDINTETDYLYGEEDGSLKVSGLTEIEITVTRPLNSNMSGYNAIVFRVFNATGATVSVSKLWGLDVECADDGEWHEITIMLYSRLTGLNLVNLSGLKLTLSGAGLETGFVYLSTVLGMEVEESVERTEDTVVDAELISDFNRLVITDSNDQNKVSDALILGYTDDVSEIPSIDGVGNYTGKRLYTITAKQAVNHYLVINDPFIKNFNLYEYDFIEFNIYNPADIQMRVSTVWKEAFVIPANSWGRIRVFVADIVSGSIVNAYTGAQISISDITNLMFWVRDMAVGNKIYFTSITGGYYDRVLNTNNTDSAKKVSVSGSNAIVWTDEQKYGKQQGSLKLTANSAETIDLVIDNPTLKDLSIYDYMEFYVYNSCASNVTITVGGKSKTCAPSAWTRITVRSSLFDAGSVLSHADGSALTRQDITGMFFRIQGMGADESIYISSIKIGNDDLILVDSADALNRMTIGDNGTKTTFTWSTDYKYGNDRGSMKLTETKSGIAAANARYFIFKTPNITNISSYDYFEFYVYNAGSADVLMTTGWLSRSLTTCKPGEWTVFRIPTSWYNGVTQSDTNSTIQYIVNYNTGKNVGASNITGQFFYIRNIAYNNSIYISSIRAVKE